MFVQKSKFLVINNQLYININIRVYRLLSQRRNKTVQNVFYTISHLFVWLTSE